MKRVNSPGGVQVAGDLTMPPEKLLIQRLQLFVQIDKHTDEKPVTPRAASVGLQSAVAFFTGDHRRIRMVTDYKFEDQQISPDTQRLFLEYEPESPEDVLGKPIDYLRNVDKLVVNYGEFLRTSGFADDATPMILSLQVRVNGVEVFAESSGPLEAGRLTREQLAFPVGSLFKEAPQRYSSAVIRR